MAGSWNHIVTDKGKFRGSQLVDENGGDTVEALEECFGMVWLLAWMFEEEIAGLHGTDEQNRAHVLDRIEDARQRYKDGLKLSPGLAKMAMKHNGLSYGADWGPER